MSEPIINHEIVEYKEDEPFLIKHAWVQNIKEETLRPHWHEELEIILTLHGHSDYYIDGNHIQAQPGRLITINSESVHNILADTCYDGADPMAIIILIHQKFLVENMPAFQTIYFLNEKTETTDGIKQIIMKLSDYERGSEWEYGYLYAKGLVLQLVSLVCAEGAAKKEDIQNINYDKNIYRMKGVLQYVANHYQEHMTQAEVAKKFYFNKDYFSRYFKKCMGITFSEYLLDYRLENAKKDLLATDLSVTEIAGENGFSDDRRLILAFKKKYQTTPLQYRKKEKMRIIIGQTEG